MSDTQLIKDKLDIVDFINEYVQLKPAGVNHKGCCPFHHEKTPSFMVNRERQSWHCFGCFPKGSLVQTDKGLKEINKIEVGERVMTHRGRLRKVSRILGRDYNGSMVELYTRKSSHPVRLTSDHKVYVIRTKNCKQKGRKTRLCQKRCKQNCPDKFFKDYTIELVRTETLKRDDYLLYPVNQEIKDIGELRPTDYLNRREYKYGPKIGELPDNIKINSNFLKIIGYWIAEGSSHRAYIRFSLGGHENNFANDIIKLTKKVFGIESKQHKRKSKKSGLEITCCNSNLSNIFENLCGKGAANKHIPYNWECLPLEKQRILLEAIFRGDGTTSKKGIKSRAGYRSITTISPILAFQLKNILLRLGIMPSCNHTEPKIDKNGVRHRKSYTIFWYERVYSNYTDWCEENGTVYAVYPIKKIKKYNFKGKVYNLTVFQDHSYVTQNFAVGNCSKGGDIFSFLQEIEGMEFVEALKFLADRAGVPLEFRAGEVNSSQKNRIKEINKEAARFFHNFLLKMPASKPAMKYLEERGLTQDTIENWQIGFVPDQWDLLTGYLLKKGYSVDDLVDSGLIIKREGSDSKSQRGFYDRFRGRIMFPIWDVHDTVIGFTGRVLVETEKSGGKYVNTPQTVVYDKSRVVFGLNKAKQEIKSKDLIVMVEGQMDVIACHQADMKNVVATSGTAMTEQQVKLLKRYSNKMNIAFDADNAGQAAAKRGIDLALEEGMDVKVIKISEGNGKDPDECIKKNKQIWFDAVTNAQGIMDWYFNKALNNKNLSDPKQKQFVADELLKEIMRIPFAVEQDHWLRELGSKINVDVAVLRENMKQIKESLKKRLDQKDAGEIKMETKLPENTKLDILLERFFMLILKLPENYKKDDGALNSAILSTPKYVGLYESWNRLYNESSSIDINQLRDSIADNNSKEVLDLLLMKGDLEFTSFSLDEVKNEMKQLLQQIEETWTKKRRSEIIMQLNEAEKNKDRELSDKLLLELQKLNN